MKRPRLTEQPEPMMLATLRTIWVEHRDDTTRALLREIARLHDVLRTVDQASGVVASVWMAERGGRLTALHQLNLLLEREPAVMEQKVRRRGERSVRGVAPQPSAINLDDDRADLPIIRLDVPDERI